MHITVSSFGRIGDREAQLYTLTNTSGASVSLCDFGAHLVSVCVPDKTGCIKDVCLGFDNAAAYDAVEYSFFGGTIGRVGNRIAGGHFTLCGQAHQLYRNNGENTLHGGRLGFDRNWWQGEIKDENTVIFSRISPDGEENFPGRMTVSVAFSWLEDNTLRIEYTAVSDRDTLCNLTNHAYFNLGDTSNILDHTVTVYADRITQVREDLIPTGIDEPVDHLPCDLRKGVVLREGIARSSEYPIMISAKGYDFNYPIRGEGFRLHAEAYAADSGRLMQVYSTEPCMQLYTGQYMDAAGRGGLHYGKHGGFAMETQHHPDAIHHPQFPTTVLKAGDTYHSVTEYRFSLR
ncbi:MAG: galactose mutarotase [Clostridia bacterium]|nr:galactose mutarotase [Clostridia bacterium]